jgi:hypothetical protein
MPDLRTLSFDPARLPACHRCGAPAIVERDGHGITHVTWRHERGCRVLSSNRERMRLNSALASASILEPRPGGRP